MGLRLVQLEVPYDTWSEPLTQEIFCKMIELKINGYLTTYPYGILPCDATDFVATHFLVCEESSTNQLTLLAGYKAITLERCQIHQLGFPCLNVLQASGADLHYDAVKKLVESYQKAPHKLSYGSGFTIRPETRADRNLSAQLKEILMSFATFYGLETSIDCYLGFGMTKVKADRFFFSWGYKPFSIGDIFLPIIQAKSHFLEESRLMQMNQFSGLALETSSKYKELWDNRIIISKSLSSSQKIAA